MAKKEEDANPSTIERMLAVQEEIGAIEKSREAGRDGEPKWKYRGIDDVYNALHELMVKHGLIVTTKVLESKQEKVTLATAKGPRDYMLITLHNQYTFQSTGEGLVITESVGSGMDNNDKFAGKAMSYCSKYMFCHVFTTPTSDLPDTDKDTFGDDDAPPTPGAKKEVKADQPASTSAATTPVPVTPKSAAGLTPVQEAIAKAKAIQERQALNPKAPVQTPAQTAAQTTAAAPTTTIQPPAQQVPAAKAVPLKLLGPAAIASIKDTFKAEFGIDNDALEMIAMKPPQKWDTHSKVAFVQLHTALQDGEAIGSSLLPPIIDAFMAIDAAVTAEQMQGILETAVQRKAAEWSAIDVNTIGSFYKQTLAGDRTVQQLAE